MALHTATNRPSSWAELAALEVPPGQCAVLLVEGGERLLEAVAADEAHGVIGPAVGVGAQAVDRHDAGVLQSASDFGLE